MGTELQRRGVDTPLPLWSASALLSHPDIVQEIHRDYLLAGAQILTTNTFRTSRWTLKKAGMGDRTSSLNALAVELARRAREKQGGGKTIWIAGSIAPLEDCYSPHLAPDEETAYKAHQEQAQLLADAGVDFLLLETMNTVAEARGALRAAVETHLPVAVSFCCSAQGRLLSGESLKDAFSAITPYQPLFISINCTPVKATTLALQELRACDPKGSRNFGAYANAGELAEEPGKWLFSKDMTPQKYAEYAKQWITLGAKVVGGCCGTTPEYIRVLCSLLQG